MEEIILFPLKANRENLNGHEFTDWVQMKQQVRQKRWMWRIKQVFKWQVCFQVRSQATDSNSFTNINAKSGFILERLI